MPQISALSPSRRDPTRVTVKVDGQAVGKVSQQQAHDLDLRVGQTWDAALAQRVAEATAFDAAMKAALQRLNRRAMSGAQLKRRLVQKDHAPSIVDRVIERLAEIGALDDEAYGRMLIEHTLARRAAGPRLLRVKLMQKGLDRNLIDRLIADGAPAGDDAAEGAVELARKKLRAMHGLDERTQKRRLWGMLARRGFEGETIDNALRQVMKGGDEEE